ncbi:transposase [Ferrimicrobium acidiphilum]|uniref:transposase n=1 Tax=Ferrimicrobium acidiphilum TaxID=121039 RepID=UPI0023F1CCE4|nr:transposase [Ferrimicrobium acidiphilum]
MSLDEFFDDLGEERIAKIKAATMDLGPAFAKAFREKAPNALDLSRSISCG